MVVIISGSLVRKIFTANFSVGFGIKKGDWAVSFLRMAILTIACAPDPMMLPSS